MKLFAIYIPIRRRSRLFIQPSIHSLSPGPGPDRKLHLCVPDSALIATTCYPWAFINRARIMRDLLKAFQLLLQSGCAISLVIAGPMGEGKPFFNAWPTELGIADHVVFTGFVNDADLRALYSGARVCVCPSLYEGFGFTVLEAMACGTPVVCSSATSLPEVAGKAALYFDPRRPEEMAVQLGRAFSDDACAVIFDCRWTPQLATVQLVRNRAANFGRLSPGFAVATAESGLRMKAAGNHGFVKVAFDASALKTQYDHHGIQVYTRNLLAALQRIAEPNGMELRPFLPSARRFQSYQIY